MVTARRQCLGFLTCGLMMHCGGGRAAPVDRALRSHGVNHRHQPCERHLFFTIWITSKLLRTWYRICVKRRSHRKTWLPASVSSYTDWQLHVKMA